jgi:hypothetical protein
MHLGKKNPNDAGKKLHIRQILLLYLKNYIVYPSVYLIWVMSGAAGVGNYVGDRLRYVSSFPLGAGLPQTSDDL